MDFTYVTLGEENGLRVLKNKLLRKTFGPKREGVAGGWKKFSNKDLRT